MNRPLHHSAFAAGLLAIGWVAWGYLPGNPLALALVLPIGAVFLIGAWELQRFHQATTGLARVLDATTEAPASLGPWLARLPASLHNAVRLRVEGERVVLPGPALTPYLAGLLVLLGMLGTFLGMVVTLKGTGLALENASDVQAIRMSLAAPVKGLGLAFGTSVAGVAASAMLGLMAALARRERQRGAQQLDSCIATTLRGFSRAHQRDESLRLQRVQADMLPALVLQLQGLASQLALQGQAQQDLLLASQARFHGEVQQAYSGLAESVDRSLKTSLVDSARLTAAAIEPAVQATLAGLAHQAATLRDTMATAVQQQLSGIASTFEHRSTAMLQQAGDTLAAALDAFEKQAGAQRTRRVDAQAAFDAASAAREADRLAAFHDGLAAMTATLQRQAQHDAAAMADHQQQICQTLERTAQRLTAQADTQARAILADMQRLVQAAAEAPRAAAQVIGELRHALSDSLVRDNAALDERNRLLGSLGGLLDAVNHAGIEQRAAIDALVRSTGDVLDRVGARFTQTVDAESHVLQAVAAQVTGSAAEVASLGEGFGVAVQLFSQASERLMAQLQRIEAALGQSMARSDEQLAYYVAQAREIVDLTLGSHKQVVDDLQQLARARAPVAPAQAHAA